MDDLDRAVELFGLVLQTRCQKFGGTTAVCFRQLVAFLLHNPVQSAKLLLFSADVDIQCASTYFRYGAALFYKAQDEQDVFGAPLQAAAASTGDAAEADDDESGNLHHWTVKATCII